MFRIILWDISAGIVQFLAWGPAEYYSCNDGVRLPSVLKGIWPWSLAYWTPSIALGEAGEHGQHRSLASAVWCDGYRWNPPQITAWNLRFLQWNMANNIPWLRISNPVTPLVSLISGVRREAPCNMLQSFNITLTFVIHCGVKYDIISDTRT